MPFIKRAVVEGIEFVEGPVDVSSNKEIIEKIINVKNENPIENLTEGEQV